MAQILFFHLLHQLVAVGGLDTTPLQAADQAAEDLAMAPGKELAHQVLAVKATLAEIQLILGQIMALVAVVVLALLVAMEQLQQVEMEVLELHLQFQVLQ
jgi:hypothetical protein